MADAIAYVFALSVLQIVGVAGFIAYIFGFGAVQMGWMDGNGASYSACNVLAASLVGLSLLAEFNLASALIQISWIIIGCVGIARRVKRRSHGPSSPRQDLNWGDAG
jgi:hypothetical protein